MKLYCDYIDIYDLDDPNLFIYKGWSKYNFGTKKVSCAWCQKIDCDTYEHCVHKCNETDHRLCTEWRIDY